MRDIKSRAAMEQPKTRQKDAIPRTAVRILQRHYAQQKQERQTQHQRQPVEYATEQVRQGMAEVTRLTFRATQQLQRKYVWGDRIFEKCGIGRDERGDGGKTLEIRGKRRLSARDGGANYQQS